jgi:phosphatidylserine/phosphatidylglycerophosphate/cardiolipin synthase-like enzyme
MHHKLFFGKNIDSKTRLIGSFNFTKSADIANQESVVVLDDGNIIQSIYKQYANLKNRSVSYSLLPRIILLYKPGNRLFQMLKISQENQSRMLRKTCSYQESVERCCGCMGWIQEGMNFTLGEVASSLQFLPS